MSKASQLERLMLDLVNDERRGAGLNPLKLELRLNDSAERHSRWMIDVDQFSHTGAGGSDAGARMRDAGFAFEGRWTWGENIALQSERGSAGPADDVADLHRGLMNSPGHRANILNPDFEVLGIGIERGDYKGYDAVVVTQNFARSSAPMRFDDAATPPAPPPAPPPEPEAPAFNTPPLALVDDFELAPGQFHRIAKRVDYRDAEGDAAVRFEIDGPDAGARVLLGRLSVDARDGYAFAADELAGLTIQFNPSGADQTFRLRAFDGRDWGPWDSFTIRAPRPDIPPDPMPEPAAPPKPGLLAASADDIVLRPGGSVTLADVVSVATGAAPLRSFKIVDPAGGAELWMSRKGVIDASEGAWFGPKALDLIQIRAGEGPSRQEMAVQLHDGAQRSAWETFTVTVAGWDDVA